MLLLHNTGVSLEWFGENPGVHVLWKTQSSLLIILQAFSIFFLLLQQYFSFGQGTSKGQQISLYHSLYHEPLITVGLYFNLSLDMYWQDTKPLSYKE